MLIGSSWSRVKWLLFYILATSSPPPPPLQLPTANLLGDTWGPSLAAVHSKAVGAANEDRLSQNHQQTHFLDATITVSCSPNAPPTPLLLSKNNYLQYFCLAVKYLLHIYLRWKRSYKSWTDLIDFLNKFFRFFHLFVRSLHLIKSLFTMIMLLYSACVCDTSPCEKLLLKPSDQVGPWPSVTKTSFVIRACGSSPSVRPSVRLSGQESSGTRRN